MKRRDPSQTPGLNRHAQCVYLAKEFPNLNEFLTAATFDDGARREGPTLTFWCAGGQFKANVKDRAEGQVLWLSAGSWLELLQMIELMVLESDAPWRHDDQEHDRNKKRVK